MKLQANPGYWNRARGPHLQEVVFRNDLSSEKALDLVCDTEGEVDLVTEVQPKDAQRVQSSAFAQLITIDAVRVLAGVLNRHSDRFPLQDKRARQALNFAIDRKEIVSEVLLEFATPLAGLTPLSATSALPHRLTPYPHDPKRHKNYGSNSNRQRSLCALQRNASGLRLRTESKLTCKQA